MLLLRLDDGVMRARPGRSDWVQNGNVAFSKVCTHAGCPVALYRRATHAAVLPVPPVDVRRPRRARRPSSGPATRALPQLALDVDRDGYLIARDGFVDPVGPDDWERAV